MIKKTLIFHYYYAKLYFCPSNFYKFEILAPNFSPFCKKLILTDFDQVNAHVDSDSHVTSASQRTVDNDLHDMLTWHMSHCPRVRWPDQNQWRPTSYKWTKIKKSKVQLWKINIKNCKFVKLQPLALLL
jgi:hypothetical protein